MMPSPHVRPTARISAGCSAGKFRCRVYARGGADPEGSTALEHLRLGERAYSSRCGRNSASGISGPAILARLNPDSGRGLQSHRAARSRQERGMARAPLHTDACVVMQRRRNQDFCANGHPQCESEFD